MVGIETSFEERAQLRESLGLNDPSLVQFARFAGNALKGEFGMSYQHKPAGFGSFQGAPARHT